MTPPSYRRPTIFEIDLVALVRNAAIIMAEVHPARLMAIVKADAYGHGAVAVSQALSQVGVSAFGVATADEGIELREAGVEGLMLVLSEVSEEALVDALTYGLTLTVARPRMVNEIIAAWSTMRERGRGSTPPTIHLSVDTGMRREGGTVVEVCEAARLAKSGGLKVEGLFSHLARADEGRAGAVCTTDQMSQFAEISAGLAKAGIALEVCHLGSTAGAFGYRESRWDMVRSGIALYGYPPSRFVAIPGLTPVGTLRSALVARIDVGQGQAVSYGHRRPREHPGAVGIVPIGYADGVPRSYFEHGGEVLIAGERYPLAGTVTMDQIAVDLGDSSLDVGEEVVLIGRQGAEFIGADEWAELLGTISYEVLCGIGPRVPRQIRAAL